MSERERELKRLLAEVAERYQRAYREEAQPLIDELVKIEQRKPPQPVLGPDGTWWRYIGPGYDDLAQNKEV